MNNAREERLKDKIMEKIADDLGMQFDDDSEIREIAWLALSIGRKVNVKVYSEILERSRNNLNKKYNQSLTFPVITV